MRPSNELIEKIKGRSIPLIDNNMENLISDFNESSGDREVSQTLYDNLFVSFLAGVTVPINPGSKFNRNFNGREDRREDIRSNVDEGSSV